MSQVSGKFGTPGSVQDQTVQPDVSSLTEVVRSKQLDDLGFAVPIILRKRFDHSIASSRDLILRIAQPPNSSFNSMNGPSVTVNFHSRA